MPVSKRTPARAALLSLLLLVTSNPVAAESVRYWVPDNPWVQAMLTMMEGFGLISRVDDWSVRESRWYDSYSPQTWMAMRFSPWSGSGSRWNAWSSGVDRFGGVPGPLGSTYADPWSSQPWSSNPWPGNPWSGNPWSGNPWSGNPFSANPLSAAPLNHVPWGAPGSVAPGWTGPGPPGIRGSRAPTPRTIGATQDIRGLWANDNGEVLMLDNGVFAYRDGAGRTLRGQSRQVSDRLLARSEDGQTLAFQFRSDGRRLVVRGGNGLTREFVRIR